MVAKVTIFIQYQQQRSKCFITCNFICAVQISGLVFIFTLGNAWLEYVDEGNVMNLDDDMKTSYKFGENGACMAFGSLCQVKVRVWGFVRFGYSERVVGLCAFGFMFCVDTL